MFRITRYVYDARVHAQPPLVPSLLSREKKLGIAGGPRNHSLSIEVVRGLFRAYPVGGSEKMRMHARGLEAGEDKETH